MVFSTKATGEQTNQIVCSQDSKQWRTHKFLEGRGGVLNINYPPANRANEQSKICVVSRGGKFFN